MRQADRDSDSALSEREFLVGAERLSRFMNRQRPEMMSDDDGQTPDRKPRSKKSAAKANSQ
jgi:hypothetical protein